MGNHGHDHGNLYAGAVNTQLHLSFLNITVNQREDNFVCGLIQDSGNTQYQYRPGITQHAFHQCHIENVFESRQFRNEESHNGCLAHQIQSENIAHTDSRIVEKSDDVRIERIEFGQYQEIKQVGHDVQEDEQQIQCGKLYRSFLIAEPGKRDGQKGIQCHTGTHNADIFRMGGIAHCLRDLGQKAQNHAQEKQGDGAHDNQGCGINHQRLFTFLVGEAEESGFHSESQNHQNQSHIGINIGHYSVTSGTGRQHGGVKRYEQIVQKASDNAAQSINCGVFHHRL